MQRLTWLDSAINDLVHLRRQAIAADSNTATSAAAAIKKNITILLDSPQLGIPVENFPDYYDWIIPCGTVGYILLRYRLYNDHIYIVQLLL